MTPLELRPITRENWLEALSLGVDPAQRSFVAGVEPVAAVALAKAYVQPGGKTVEPYGIYHESAMVGFFNLHYTPGSPDDYWLFHFFIDQRFQGRKFGTHAITLLTQHLQDHHPLCRRLRLTVHPDNRAAQHFYQKLGFADEGVLTYGEQIYSLDIDRIHPNPDAASPADRHMSFGNDGPCVFCAIVAGKTPSWTVYEDDATVAFLDIAQATPGHTLVVPRGHVPDIWSLSEDEAARIMRSVYRVSLMLSERLAPLGLNISQSNGRAAWQEVFHYHVHVVPRYGADQLVPPWRSTSPSPDTLAATQRRILGG